MAASATLALKAGVWFRRGRLFIVSPDSLAQRARCQAESPLIVLFRFLRPALVGMSIAALNTRIIWFPRVFLVTLKIGRIVQIKRSNHVKVRSILLTQPQ